MLTGKRFTLRHSILAVERVDGKRVAVEVPEGGIVRVLSGPPPDDDKRLLEVAWDGRLLSMFAEDIEKRAEQISDESARMQY